jgi:hypothetical protein
MPEIEKSSENWNVALGYTNLKILKPLVEMDKYVRIAIYGTEDLKIEELNIPAHIITKLRINAINRLIDILREVIENAHFACKKKESKEAILLLKSRLFKVIRYVDGIYSRKSDSRTNTTTIIINEEHFNRCLENLRYIKEKIPDVLNMAGLIFPMSEETNLDDLKNQLIEGG